MSPLQLLTPPGSRAQQTDSILSTPGLTADQHALVLKTLLYLLQIYHDLNSQDLPEFFEDRLGEFMPLLLKYLDYSTPFPSQDDDDEEEEQGDLESAKAEICEIAQLYSLRYLDAFGEGGYLGPFVEKTWGLLTKLGAGVKYDGVSSALLSYSTRQRRWDSRLNCPISSSSRKRLRS